MTDNEMRAFMNGVYIVKAIGATFGKKNYPDKPIGLFKTNDKKEEITEERIKLEREKLIMSLQIMQTNFELSHKK